MDDTDPQAGSIGDPSAVEHSSIPGETDAAAELEAMRERLAMLEAAKAESDRQAADSARVVKIATAKAAVIAKHLNGDFELDSFLPNTDDAAALEAAAVKLQQKFQKIRPAFGGGKDGGTIPGMEPRNHKTTPASQLISSAFENR